MKRNILILFLISTISLSAQNQKIEWISFEKAIELNEQEPKKFLIDVYTDWCGWCKRMDATTFSNPVIIDYINKNYWAIKLDAERKDTVKLGEQLFVNENPNGRRSPHQLAVALLNGKMSYPSIVYLDENVELLQAVGGYHDAEGIEPILKYFGENAYRKTSWEDYTSSFDSDLKIAAAKK
ncbi:MAG: DUF255 domain-containing protein [Vicingaceae bacterium]